MRKTFVVLILATLCLLPIPQLASAHPRYPYRCPVVDMRWSGSKCPDWRVVQLR